MATYSDVACSARTGECEAKPRGRCLAVGPFVDLVTEFALGCVGGAREKVRVSGQRRKMGESPWTGASGILHALALDACLIGPLHHEGAQSFRQQAYQSLQ